MPNCFQATADSLKASLAELRQQQQRVNADIQEVMVNLQFLGRVQQIVEHVIDDLGRDGNASNSEVPPDMEEWLARLSSTYTTLEQQGSQPTKMQKLVIIRPFELILAGITQWQKVLVGSLMGTIKKRLERR